MNQTRISKEKETIELMIRLYCRKKEGNRELCPDCKTLLDYAHTRLDRCPFQEDKASCKKCPVHCYKQDQREKMRKVMRFVGPRMIWYAPVEALRHWFR